MSICHIFYNKVNISVIFFKLNQGYEMSIVIKHTKSLLDRFEDKLENWAEKVF